MNESLADLLKQFSYYNTQVVLYGVSALGASAGMIGSFAVLRKRSLTGDAVAHAALPGVCIAFMLLGERNLTVMLLGALASGVLGMMIISGLSRWTRVREDAAIGTVLSVFPGLGFVLSRLIQKHDWGGSGGKAGIESFIYGKTAGMVLGDAHLILGSATVCLLIVLVLYKEFKTLSFDPGFARSLGWPVYRLDLLLMGLIAAAVVIGLPAVGVILMAALLIIPSAAARFWTDKFSRLLLLSGVFGLATGFIGASLSAMFDQLPAGPIIVLTGTTIFIVSLLFGTRRGIIARLVNQWRFERELADRQLLRVALEILETRNETASSLQVDDWLGRKSWNRSRVEKLIAQAVRQGELVPEQGRGYRLTAAGYARAVEVTRGYRLWEAFLSAYPDQAGGVANLASISVAEHVSPAIVQELTTSLRAAGRWPGESDLATQELAG